MTNQDVSTTLAPLIFTVDDVPYIMTSVYETGYTSISVDDFVERFESAEVTHASLSAHENADSWIERFDDWQTRGILV